MRKGLTGYYGAVQPVHTTLDLPLLVGTAAHVRAFLRENLASFVAERDLSDVLLVASELINVASWGDGHVWEHQVDQFGIDATYDGTALVCLREMPIELFPDDREQLDALVLVGRLSTNWGISRSPRPHIWAELETTTGD